MFVSQLRGYGIRFEQRLIVIFGQPMKAISLKDGMEQMFNKQDD